MCDECCLRGGVNIDIRSGSAVPSPNENHVIGSYFGRSNPRLFVIPSPCASFPPWLQSRPLQTSDRTTWLRIRVTVMEFARRWPSVARMHVHYNRVVVAGSPNGNGLWTITALELDIGGTPVYTL